MNTTETPHAFTARNVTKTFPGVLALEDVSITLRPGSIHALLGENGAGKSTLIKVITGVHQADKGALVIAGEPVNLRNIHHANELGVSVVHQERHLIPRLTIAENIMLDRLGKSDLARIDYPFIEAEARKWLGVLDIDLDPRTKVQELSVAQMQLVEVAKALSHQSKVLLMDEPTTSLTSHETDTLFALLRRLRDSGVSIVFVSHKLEEVLEVCDDVTVLRDGRNACESRSIQDMTRGDLVQMMIGRAEQISDWEARDRTGGEPALALDGVGSELGHKDINLSLHKGEILGLYGLVGAGRTELAKVILGLVPLTAGRILIKGKPVKISNVRQARDTYRIGYVSEDRKNEGLILSHSVLQNAGITVWQKLVTRFGFLARPSVERAVLPSLNKLEVKTPSLSQLIGNLSGGNQQKVSVAKWLAAGVEILIVDEPSVGIDIKTKAYLHQLLRDLSDAGTAILLITSDMPEMIGLADRILVIQDYRIVGQIDNDRNTETVGRRIMACIHDIDDDEEQSTAGTGADVIAGAPV